MGKYDKLDRIYFANKERFVELISVGIYHKRLKVKGSQLQNEEAIYSSAEGNLSRERDLLLSMVDARVKYGVEIENYADYSMPRRFLTYEACEYEKQASEIEYNHKLKKDLKGFAEMKSKMKKDDFFIPVINMLLYLGEGHWKGHSTMREFFQIPEKYKPYIQDRIINYSFPVLEADHVNPMDFQTDLRQFFQIMQCRSDKNKIRELVQYEEFQNLCMETQRVIAVHLDNQGIIKQIIEEEKEMCKALNDWAKEERAIGREEGMKENLLGNIKAIMKNMNLSLNQAMDALGLSENEKEEYSKILR